ncbi:MAG: HAMP domain-containing protein [Planctomycetota bacterium]
MKIRRRVTQYILAVMTIVLVLLAAMVVSDVLVNERRMQVARARVAAGMIKNYIRQNSQMQTIYKSPVEPGHLPTDLALLADNMIESGWVGAILVIRDGEVYVSVPELSGDRQYDCEETFQNIEAKNIFEPGVDWRDSVNRSYSIHVRSLPVGSSIYESLTGVLGVFFVGTLLLLWTVFALLRRLVVSPIERLASAAETNRRARLPSLIDIGDPGTDEMRSLVAAFNAMLTELDDIKRNLEQRVQDETLARMRAQAGLIAEQRLAATGRLAAGVAHENQ